MAKDCASLATTLAKTQQLNGNLERKHSEHCPSDNREFYIVCDGKPAMMSGQKNIGFIKKGEGGTHVHFK